MHGAAHKIEGILRKIKRKGVYLMTKRIIVIALILVLALLISSLVKNLNKSPAKEGTTDSNESFKIIVKPNTEDSTVIKVYNHYKEQIEDMTLEDYVIGAVSGEMPATFELEALKAQAVAARTLVAYKLRANGGTGCIRNRGADICTSYSCCQAWIADSDKKKNWGDQYEKNLKKIEQAVWQTWGEIITYQGTPIEVFYHSTSNGMTEDVQEVFSNSLPYYKVVDSKGEEEDPRFYGSVQFTYNEMVNKIKQRYPNSSVTASNLQNQIKINSYTNSGRVKNITVGGITMTGTEFRLMLGLRSADFTIHFETDKVTIKTKGFGHGVGMSQVGANKMAQRGSDHREIITHYYQGVAIEKLKLN